MASQHASRTSQKLYFAQLLQESLPKLKDDQVINVAAVDESITESIAFHLFGAYQSLIFEIVDFPLAMGPVTMTSFISLLA